MSARRVVLTVLSLLAAALTTVAGGCAVAVWLISTPLPVGYSVVLIELALLLSVAWSVLAEMRSKS